jgi:hypothetical protein
MMRSDGVDTAREQAETYDDNATHFPECFCSFNGITLSERTIQSLVESEDTMNCSREGWTFTLSRLAERR